MVYGVVGHNAENHCKPRPPGAYCYTATCPFSFIKDKKMLKCFQKNVCYFQSSIPGWFQWQSISSLAPNNLDYPALLFLSDVKNFKPLALTWNKSNASLNQYNKKIFLFWFNCCLTIRHPFLMRSDSLFKWNVTDWVLFIFHHLTTETAKTPLGTNRADHLKARWFGCDILRGHSTLRNTAWLSKKFIEGFRLKKKKILLL